MGRYRTVEITSRGEYRDRGSRFYAFVSSVHSEEEVKLFLNNIRKEHVRASHVCFAYHLNDLVGKYRVNDDGEPANTAGMPIYNQLKKYELKNTIIAVVRYFGGVLLGKGGLIKAYGSAAEDAIKNGKIIEREELISRLIEITAQDYPVVVDKLKRNGFHIISQLFEEVWKIMVEYPLEKNELLDELIKN